MDHDQITHTSEIYDPDGSVTNSVTEKIENTGSNPSAGGLVGTPVNANASTNNLAGGALSNDQQNKSESVILLNNSRTTTNVVKAAGEIRRLTASVLVNQGSDARTDTSMTQLTNIVKNAIGMHAGAAAVRPDDIVVAEMQFNRDHVAAAEAQISSAATKDLISTVLKNLLYVLLGGAALFAFVKLVHRSGDETIQTGVPVGQLLGAAGPVPAVAGVPGGVPAPGGAAVPFAAAPGAAGGGASGEAPGAKPITIEGSAGPVEINTDNMTLEDIESTIADARTGKMKLSPADIQQLMHARDEERERMKLLASTEDDVEVIEEQKQKLIMDFGLGAKQPERVNIEVLRDMITESPETMAVAARRWLKNEDAD